MTSNPKTTSAFTLKGYKNNNLLAAWFYGCRIVQNKGVGPCP